MLKQIALLITFAALSADCRPVRVSVSHPSTAPAEIDASSSWKEYAALTGDQLPYSKYVDLFGSRYRVLDGTLYEVKTEQPGSSVLVSDGLFRADADHSMSVLVRRNAFKSRQWKIRMKFKINHFAVVDPQPDTGEPVDFTFSDEGNAGFLIMWPTRIEYFDLGHKGPSVKKIAEWAIPDISNKVVDMTLTKNNDALRIELLDVVVDTPIDGRQISSHNYEIPAFVRYSNSLERRWATRNFIRFGTLYYPFISPNPELKLYSLRIEQ